MLFLVFKMLLRYVGSYCCFETVLYIVISTLLFCVYLICLLLDCCVSILCYFVIKCPDFVRMYAEFV